MPVHPIRHGESAEKSARPPHLMRVGRLSQGGQWPMCSHQVARLLWCAPSSERGVVQHWGSKSWQWQRPWQLAEGSGPAAQTSVVLLYLVTNIVVHRRARMPHT